MWGRATVYLLISSMFLAVLGCTASASVTVTPTIVPSPSATEPQIATASPTATPVTPTRAPSPTATFTLQPTPSTTPTNTQFPPLPTVAPEFWASVGVSPDTLVATQVDGDIAAMRVDGTHLNQLTTYGYNSDPVLSTDRKRIAYRSVPKSITSSANPGDKLNVGYYNIWVITVDGEQAWHLTNSELQRGVPVWSPDNRKVAFTEGSNSMLVEIEVDTQARREIIPSMPRYQPNGNGIGYIMADGGLAWVDTAGAIHTIIPTVTLPISTTVHDFDWLPDGQHIVYTLAHDNVELMPDGHDYSTWIAQIDGADLSKLLGREPFGYGPRDIQVSPDGKIISVIGSSYGDACAAGADTSFLLLAPDLKSAQLATSEDFKGHAERVVDFYPTSGVTWISSHLALARFGITCPLDEGDTSGAGSYLIDPIGRRMVQITH